MGDAVMTFPTDGAVRQWPLTQTQIDAWSRAYPRVDIETECWKALAWCEANPSKRKTAKGMPRFLLAWLNRSQTVTTFAPAPRTTARLEPVYSRDWQDECRSVHGFECNSHNQHDIRMALEAGRRESKATA